jgi:type I restriction enzyme, S subunit
LLFHRVPPLAEQQEIVRRVEALFAVAGQIEARFKKVQARVDKLTPSLLARAFSGKLVPQDPNDEPAEKLLERIRAGRKERL